MTKKKTTSEKKEVTIAGPAKTPTPKVEKRAPHEISAEQAKKTLTPIDPKDAEESHKPSATQPIPPVKEKIDKPNTDKTGAVKDLHDTSTDNKLAFGNFHKDRSMKFKIDADNIGTPQHQSDEMRKYFNKFLDEKSVKPNNLFINTTSLEKLGWRDIATDLGLNIKESSVYNDDEMVLAIDL